MNWLAGGGIRWRSLALREQLQTRSVSVGLNRLVQGCPGAAARSQGSAVCSCRVLLLIPNCSNLC